jgi:hypothetical protein
MWMIQNFFLEHRPQRIRVDKYYALSVDPCYSYSERKLMRYWEFVIEQMVGNATEINYVIEQKGK